MVEVSTACLQSVPQLMIFAAKLLEVVLPGVTKIPFCREGEDTGKLMQPGEKVTREERLIRERESEGKREIRERRK